MFRLGKGFTLVCTCAIVAVCLLMTFGSQALADACAVDPIFIQHDRRSVSELQRQPSPADVPASEQIACRSVSPVNMDSKPLSDEVPSRDLLMILTGSIALIAGIIIAKKHISAG